MAGDKVRSLCTICGGRYCTELMAKRYLGGGELLEGLTAANVSPADLERLAKDDENVWLKRDFFTEKHQVVVVYTLMCFDIAGGVIDAEIYTDGEVVPLYDSRDVIRAKNSKQS